MSNRTAPIANAVCALAGSNRFMAKVVADVAEERLRQVVIEGFGAEHDDHHQAGVLARAGACYAVAAAQELEHHDFDPPPWPWDRRWWKPKGSRSNLVRAAALLLAEIERMDRRGEA